MNKKKIREYNEKFGHVPNNYFERFQYILKELKVSDKILDNAKKAIRKILNMNWLRFNFIFYFHPNATPRARYSGITKMFYVKDAKNNNDVFKEFIENTQEYHKLITTPTRMNCDMFFEMPSGMSKVEKILAELKLIPMISRPDWDNLGKTYSDMCQKHLLLDDSLVFDGRVRKYYSFKPRIEISIEFMEEYDCKYNKKKVESWNNYKKSIDLIDEKDTCI